MTVPHMQSTTPAVFNMKKQDILTRPDNMLHCANSSANDIIDGHSLIDAIPPRTFNQLNFTATTVTKTSVDPSILGEIYFYQHIPSYLSCHFPRLVKAKLPHHLDVRDASLTIERIYGATFSKMAVCDKLTAVHIRQLLLVLHRLHTAEPAPVNDDAIYINHARKVRSRRSRHQWEYSRLCLDNSHFQHLLDRLDAYERHRRGLACAIVHGDPVFTNVLATSRTHCPSDDDATVYDPHTPVEYDTDDVALKLIDMRGMQGDNRTLQGDAVYDLAKVLQSLLGYDFILADVYLSKSIARRLSAYLRVFWKCVCELYGNHVSITDVLTVCASLWTSLIPLHQNSEQQQQQQHSKGRCNRTNAACTDGATTSRKTLFACVARIVLHAAVHLDNNAYDANDTHLHHTENGTDAAFCQANDHLFDEVMHPRVHLTARQQAQIDYVVNLPLEIADAFENL